MSDDDGPPGKKGKGKGKGKGKDDFGKGGGGGGGRKGGGGKDRDGGGGGPSVTRLKVMPKFLQEIQQRHKPAESKRGLAHAELRDKSAPMGRNDDDEYDLEGAQIVDSDLTAEDVVKFHAARKPNQGSSSAQPRAFFASEAPRPAEEDAGPVKFRSMRKPERSSGAANGDAADSRRRNALALAQEALDDGDMAAADEGGRRAGDATSRGTQVAGSRRPAAKVARGASERALPGAADDDDDFEQDFEVRARRRGAAARATAIASSQPLAEAEEQKRGAGGGSLGKLAPGPAPKKQRLAQLSFGDDEDA